MAMRGPILTRHPARDKGVNGYARTAIPYGPSGATALIPVTAHPQPPAWSPLRAGGRTFRWPA